MSRDGGGFTLLELVIVTGMLSILAIPLLQLFGVGLQATKASREMLEASFVSQALVEEILATAPAARLSLHVPEKTTHADFEYAYKRIITPHPSGLLKVSVTVYWREGPTERTYQVVTLVAKE